MASPIPCRRLFESEVESKLSPSVFRGDGESSPNPPAARFPESDAPATLHATVNERPWFKWSF
jgi:hypothetical protein